MRVFIAVAVVAVVTAFAPTLASAAYTHIPRTAISFNVDYMDVNSKQTIADCQQSCDGASGCIAFVFEPATGFCYFKDQIVGPYNTTQYDTYVKAGYSILGSSKGAASFTKYSGTQIVGTVLVAYVGVNDVNTDLSTHPTAQQVDYCGAWCFQNPTCVAFVFAPASGKCFLKSSIKESTTDATVDAYLKPGYSLTGAAASSANIASSSSVRSTGTSAPDLGTVNVGEQGSIVNAGVLAGVLTAVGVLLVALIAVLVFLLVRRKRKTERKLAGPHEHEVPLSSSGQFLPPTSQLPPGLPPSRQLSPTGERIVYPLGSYDDVNKNDYAKPPMPSPTNSPTVTATNPPSWALSPAPVVLPSPVQTRGLPQAFPTAPAPSMAAAQGERHWFFNQVASPQGLQDAMSVKCPNLQPFLVVDNFRATTEDEIDLTKGQTVTLSVLFRDGWGVGFNNDTRTFGVLPIDFLRLSDAVPAVLSHTARRESANLPQPLRSKILSSRRLLMPDTSSGYSSGR